MEALVLVHHQRVLDIEAVEGDGILADGRGEGILQHAYLVVVDVHVGKHVLHHRVQDVARLHQVVDTRGVLTLDDGLLVVGLLAVYLLRYGLVDTHRQDHLVVVGTHLHLVDIPFLLFALRVLQRFRLDVVQGQRQLLILVVLVEVVVGQVGEFLGSDHLLHHLHGRIVLAAVSAFLGTHLHLLEHPVVRLQLHEVVALHVAVHHRGVSHVAHGTEGQHPPVVARYLVVAVDVGSHADVVPLVLHAGKGDSLPRLGIRHATADHLLRK